MVLNLCAILNLQEAIHRTWQRAEEVPAVRRLRTAAQADSTSANQFV